jgi:hypothetical protein
MSTTQNPTRPVNRVNQVKPTPPAPRTVVHSTPGRQIVHQVKTPVTGGVRYTNVPRKD